MSEKKLLPIYHVFECYIFQSYMFECHLFECHKFEWLLFEHHMFEYQMVMSHLHFCQALKLFAFESEETPLQVNFSTAHHWCLL